MAYVWLPMFPRFMEWRAITKMAAAYANAPLSQYWDDTKEVGRDFKRRIVPEYPKDVAWDAYVLFDPEATWETAGEHVLGWGYTVEETQQRLFEHLARLGDRSRTHGQNAEKR